MVALMVLPNALAIETGIANDAGSASSSFSSTKGNSVDMMNTMGQHSAESSGALILSGSNVGVNVPFIKNEWNSFDGKSTARTYAHFDNDVMYMYNFAGSSTATTATASEKITAFGGAAANYFLLGGFAYNPTDYAGTYVRGALTPTTGIINYQNTVYAAPTRVSASETFYGTDMEELITNTWAERGNVDNEAQTDGDTQAMFNQVLLGTTVAASDDVKFPFFTAHGTDVTNPGTLGAITTIPATNGWAEFMGPSNQLYSGQYMDTDFNKVGGMSVDIKQATPYKASAALSANVATSSQSASFKTANANQRISFESNAYTADDLTGLNAQTGLFAWNAANTDIVYSASSGATVAQDTATQNVRVTRGSRVIKSATSNDLANGFQATESLQGSNLLTALATNMAGTDSAIAKVGSASVTQKATSLSALSITRTISSRNTLENYIADVNVNTIAGGAVVSTLAGQTTAGVTSKGASVLSAGKWSANIAIGSAFAKTSQATYSGGVIAQNDNKAASTARASKLYADNIKASTTGVAIV